MKKIVPIVVALVIGLIFLNNPFNSAKNSTRSSVSTKSSSNTDKILADAFTNHENSLQVYGEGNVIKNLPDDNKDGRHQKFIIKLSSGQTLLIAHNIDMAPRISTLSAGNHIKFYGEYEWNEKGGVIHWTHHDPDGRHEDGWLEYQGRTYQ